MAHQLFDSEQITCSLNYTDTNGNPTPAPPGAQSPIWQVDNPRVIALTPAGDRMSCVVRAAGPLGSAKVSVKSLDADGNPLAASSLDFTVHARGAPRLQIVAGPASTPSASTASEASEPEEGHKASASHPGGHLAEAHKHGHSTAAPGGFMSRKK
jgi:hypothetical protein